MKVCKDKSVYDVQRSTNLADEIKRDIKESAEHSRAFTKFKSEMFSINEPIMNKDISALSLKLIDA